MQRNRELAVNKFINEYNKYITTGNNLIEQFNVISKSHKSHKERNSNPPHDQKILHYTEEILSSLLTLERKLTEFIQEIQATSDFDLINRSLPAVNKSKSNVSLAIVKSKVLLADKYGFAHDQCNSFSRKKEYITKAYQHIIGANNTCTAKTITLNAELTHTLSDFIPYFTRLYDEYQHNDSISKSVFAARSMKNKEEAYNKFQEAIDLTTEPERKFYILFEQARDYFKLLPKLEYTSYVGDPAVLDHHLQVVHKTCQSFVLAAQIALSMTNISHVMKYTLEGICPDLYYASQYCILVSQKIWLAKNLEQRATILEDAKYYFEWADKLAQHINLHESEAQSISNELINETEKLNKDTVRHKEELAKQQALEHQHKPDRENELAEFIKILEQFNEVKKPKRKRRRRKKINVANRANTDQHNATEDNNNIEVNVVCTPHVQPMAINLDEQLKLLDQAKTSGDFIKHIQANIMLAEYYIIQTQKLKHPYHTQLSQSVDDLKLAKDYIYHSYQLIDQIKPDSAQHAPTHLSELRQCIIIVLTHINHLLTLRISRLYKIEKRDDIERNNAMAYIINKYGPDGWYKDKTEWSSLSAASQNRLMRQKALRQFQSIEKQLHQMKITLDNHTQSLPKQIAISTTDQSSAASLTHPQTSTSTTQPSLQQTRLQRCLSLHSFFKPQSMSEFAKKQKCNGRREWIHTKQIVPVKATITDIPPFRKAKC